MFLQSLEDVSGPIVSIEVSGNEVIKTRIISDAEKAALKIVLQNKIASIQAQDPLLYTQALKDQMCASAVSDLSKLG